MKLYFKKYMFVAAVVVPMCIGCSKKESESVSQNSTGAEAAVEKKMDPRAQFAQMFAKQELVQMGERIYQTPGMQTCLQCHRARGEGEGYAGAAKLQAPYTFRSFNALGGYEALKADPADFRDRMEMTLLYLLHGGALNWNANFAKDHPEIPFDWSKTGKDKYDIMMWGVAQQEMKAKVKAVHDDLIKSGKSISESEMQWLAAYSALQYIKTFEKQGKGADGKPAPKIWE